MLLVSYVLAGILFFILYCYLFNYFVCKEKFKLDYKVVLYSCTLGIIYYFIVKNNLIYIRPYFMHLYALFGLILIYRQKIIKTIIVLFCISIISFIAEFVFDFILILFFKVDVKLFGFSWFGYLISNLCIYLIMILISKLNITNKIFSNIINWYNKNEYKSFMICVILTMVIFTFLLYNNFISLLPNSILWLVNLFCIAVVFFVINYFKEKANNNRIIYEYDQLLDYVKKYEKVVDSKSKSQHEYKNQLILIKSMISKTNKKVINYIDDLYKEEKDDNDVELLRKLQYLPSGGLKGLIYYKIEEMKEKKLNVFVDVSPKIKNKKINQVIDVNLKDISKIVGVYLDNAIEACIKSKEKYIIIEIYTDNDNLVFSVSNTYKGKIDIKNMDNEGYTTNGEGKGYGLSLVKDIISHNKNLKQNKELKGIYFTQKLYIKK